MLFQREKKGERRREKERGRGREVEADDGKQEQKNCDVSLFAFLTFRARIDTRPTKIRPGPSMLGERRGERGEKGVVLVDEKDKNL